MPVRFPPSVQSVAESASIPSALPLNLLWVILDFPVFSFKFFPKVAPQNLNVTRIYLKHMMILPTFGILLGVYRPKGKMGFKNGINRSLVYVCLIRGHLATLLSLRGPVAHLDIEK